MSYGTTSMARHLKRAHSIIWEKSQDVKIDKFISIIPTKVDKITAEKITKHLSLALAETSAPYRLVENSSFRDAIQLLNSAYNLPSHQTISRRINELYIE